MLTQILYSRDRILFFKIGAGLVLAVTILIIVLIASRKGENSPIRIQLSNDDFANGKATIGTPAQEFNFLFDSGSPISWIVSTKYKGECSHTVRGYNSKLSQTYRENGRKYRTNIQDYQISGFLSADTFNLNGVEIPNTTFAEIDDFPGTFICWRKFARSIGLGLTEGFGQESFVERLISEKLISVPIVSLDYIKSHNWDADEVGTGGEVILGGIDSSRISGDIHYVQTTNPSKWQVELVKIVVKGDSRVEVCSNGCFASVKSGPYWLYGPIEEIRKINDAIGAKEGVSEGESTWTIQCNTAGKPDVVYNIGGREFALKPGDYIVDNRSERYQNCSSVFSSRKVYGNEWVLGANFIEKFYTIFNFKSGKVGFAQKN